MTTRLLIVLCTMLAMPGFAQYAKPAVFTQQKTKFDFTQRKVSIDSLAQAVDEMFPIERSVFSGKTSDGRYRVECYFDKPSKQLLKANFLVITDSLNYNKVYWFKDNIVVKMNYDIHKNVDMFYKVGDQLYNKEGNPVATTVVKKLMDLATDHFPGLYAAIFQ